MNVEELFSYKSEFDSDNRNHSILIVGQTDSDNIMFDTGEDVSFMAVSLAAVAENNKEFANAILYAAESYCERRGLDLKIPNEILSKEPTNLIS